MVEAESDDAPSAEASIAEKDVAGFEMLPELVESVEFVIPPGAGGPGGEETGGEIEEAGEPENGKAAARALDRLLRKAALILWSVRKGDGGAVDDLDLPSTPEVALGDGPLRISDEGGMDVVKHLDRQEGACLAVGAVPGGRKGVSSVAAESGGLSDRLTAGGAGLGDLPEESPEGEPKVPASAAGMGTFLTLGEEVMRNPTFEEELELMEEGALA